MRGFLLFLLKHHFTLVFLVLQLISFFLIVNYNRTQRSIFINSSNNISGSLNAQFTDFSSYFSLKEENEKLLQENTDLRNKFLKNYKQKIVLEKDILDSLYVQNYRIISGHVIHLSVKKARNFLTIDIGRRQGVKIGNGVISSEGIVGVVKTISDNYSVVLPMINTDFKVSCRINRSQYFGSLSWNADSYEEAILQDIPFHVSVQSGDSLFTTGFSSIFPTGELVGVIDKVDKNEGENFYAISVKLAVDFKSLQYVYVVDHLLKVELDSLKLSVDG